MAEIWLIHRLFLPGLVYSAYTYRSLVKSQNGIPDGGWLPALPMPDRNWRSQTSD
jgi:hypothetical protein